MFFKRTNKEVDKELKRYQNILNLDKEAIKEIKEFISNKTNQELQKYIEQSRRNKTTGMPLTPFCNIKALNVVNLSLYKLDYLPLTDILAEIDCKYSQRPTFTALLNEIKVRSNGEYNFARNRSKNEANKIEVNKANMHKRKLF